MNVRAKSVDLADVGPEFAWAFEFDESGHGRKLPGNGPIELAGVGRFVWAHLILSNVRSREWIAAQTSFPSEAREVLLSQEGHPQLEWDGDALWGTVYDLQREYQGVGEDTTDLRFVLTPRFLLTARRHPVFCADAVKKQVEGGAGFEDSAALFERMLAVTADSVGEAAHKIGAQLDSIEDRVLSEALTDDGATLLRLRRAISRQDRLVHASLSVLSQLEQRRASDALEAYRDLADRVRQRVAAYHADLRLQGDRARLLQEETAAKVAAATNRNLFVLTIVTTVLLPPAFVTGFFGMNTKGLPFGESEYGTLFAAIACGIAALLVYLLIKRFRMLG